MSPRPRNGSKILQNAALKGDQLFSALQQKSWDPSVKSLTPFPQNSAHARREPRMARAAWRGVSRRSGRASWTPFKRFAIGPNPLAGSPQRRRGSRPRDRRRPASKSRLRSRPRLRISSIVPLCDPSFTYGPWPYPDYPPFVPIFAGATIGGCGWISGPIIAPFWGLVVLNFQSAAYRDRPQAVRSVRSGRWSREDSRPRVRRAVAARPWSQGQRSLPQSDGRRSVWPSDACREGKRWCRRTLDWLASYCCSPCSGAAARVGTAKTREHETAV